MTLLSLRTLPLMPAALFLLAVDAQAGPSALGSASDADRRVVASDPPPPSPVKLSADTLHAEPAPFREIEEVVVYGHRGRKPAEADPTLVVDPLRERVLAEIRELRLLDDEFEWRSEPARLDIEPPRIRFGYDPRNASRTPEISPQVALPLDFIQPATLFSVDF